MNIFVGTLFLWGLTVFIVQPLAKFWVSIRLQKPAFAHINAPEILGVLAKEEFEELEKKCYIQANVLVLGITGLVLGLASGSPFIGIAWDRRFWPGMIALMCASFIGAFLAT